MPIKLQTEHYHLIGRSEGIRKVIDLVERAADSDSTVILSGESGTGKELIARALHHNSGRAAKRFIPVNCGAIPQELLESELFGHEKGAFTGAMQTRVGRFELADGGTIFLDEIGDMPLTLQVKLLRVLAEGEIDRVGGSKPIRINVRFITATHRNLEQAIKDGTFREDLFYRLNVIPITIPPLRERKSDIPLLVHHYLKHFNEAKGKSIAGISDAAMEILCNYQWPGNIRELANFMERMIVLTTDSTLTPRDLPDKVLGNVPKETWEPLVQEEANETPAEFIRKSRNHAYYIGMPEEGINLKQMVEEFEKELIIEALEKTNGVKNQAAALLGLNRTTLVEKLKKMKINR
ncbi:MAG: AAA domain-containing protein [Nitrospinaceae bacterium]|nr:sigma-54-dependent Fis family transcriptional regulator [Nitrospinaceae bacterium]NIR56808.1 sigma-54-dependent Fis family transcriptional regulator [Nitrospinaceae bacterium]NIS87264.1 sigma-54-dependent Fis family transcriptional regulator [Nitrospinaceae bacterium]NIT84117.1 sigma-54-dependent Fis family transcriptional regulator [Nitrospinaceae bacterium]NIU46305.1 sigma-54-dependent Fis family transcriptional regulator [Nitrospinaceae bacterium]